MMQPTMMHARDVLDADSKHDLHMSFLLFDSSLLLLVLVLLLIILIDNIVMLLVLITRLVVKRFGLVYVMMIRTAGKTEREREE